MATEILYSWLHPTTALLVNERNLTLLQRLNIPIDVTLRVDYLHYHTHKKYHSLRPKAR